LYLFRLPAGVSMTTFTRPEPSTRGPRSIKPRSNRHADGTRAS
jgi:hypothetical protein